MVRRGSTVRVRQRALSAKAPENGAFVFRWTCSASNLQWIWSRLWSCRVQNTRRGRRDAAWASAHESCAAGRNSYFSLQRTDPTAERVVRVKAELAVLAHKLTWESRLEALSLQEQADQSG